MEKNEVQTIDELIDGLFKGPKPESVAIADKKVTDKKPMESAKPPTTADANGAAAEAKQMEEEEEGTRGRPKDPSNMGNRDAEGKAKMSYDASVTSPTKKVPNETTVAKSYEISAEDFALLQRAKAAQEAEVIKKARTEQADLIKSAVTEAIGSMKSENEQLKKSVSEMEALIKSLAKKPRPQKSITSVAVLEKSFNNAEGAEAGSKPSNEGKFFSKSEMLDAAERLVLTKAFKVEDVVELEDTGALFDANKRKLLEDELRKQK